MHTKRLKSDEKVKQIKTNEMSVTTDNNYCTCATVQSDVFMINDCAKWSDHEKQVNRRAEQMERGEKGLMIRDVRDPRKRKRMQEEVFESWLIIILQH